MTSSETSPPHTPSAAKAAGLTSYRSRRWCPIPGHGSVRRVVDNKCCACLQQAKDLKAEALRKQRAKPPEVVRKERAQERMRERAREAKRVAAEALKAQKAALREQAQAERDKAKRIRRRAELQAAREAEKAQEVPAAAPVGSPHAAPMAAPGVVVVGPVGVPPWEAVCSASDAGAGCPWEDSPPWD